MKNQKLYSILAFICYTLLFIFGIVLFILMASILGSDSLEGFAGLGIAIAAVIIGALGVAYSVLGLIPMILRLASIFKEKKAFPYICMPFDIILILMNGALFINALTGGSADVIAIIIFAILAAIPIAAFVFNILTVRAISASVSEGEKKAETYLFDFDGTLVDSMPTFGAVMTRILDENGIEYGDDIIKTVTPLGYLGTAKYFRELGVPMSEAEMIEIMNEYARDAYLHTIGEKPGVIKTLFALKERGADLNVLTASPHLVLDPCLKRLGVWELFTNVWSCDDFGTTKSDPKIYALAAERIGKDISEITFIDDNINAVKVARGAGMIAFGIYDESGKDFREEMIAASDRYLETLSELI